MDQRTYIPPHIEQAMAQHMQQAMPAHLKKYVNSDKPTYVPQHAEQAIAQHMQKAMPAHLKQYAGAYMQQRVIQPGLVRPTAAPQSTFRPAAVPPTPDALRKGHSMPSAGQYTVQPESMVAGRTQPSGYAATPTPTPLTPLPPAGPPPEEPRSLNHPQAYEFIMNPEKPLRKSLLPGGGSPILKILYIAGGLLMLVVAFVVVKNLVAGGSNFTPYISVAQDQQELIHLANGAVEQTDLSTTNRNFVASTRLSLGTSHSRFLSYLKQHGTKVSTKTLNAKVSTQTDNQLVAAASATTYNRTFREIMKNKLNGYSQDLKRGYQQAKNPQGQALLKSDYDQAQLLLKQLDAT
jgi:hypothetical protein